MSVGYATMNGLTMKIEGLSQALEQKGIIITEANFKNQTNAVIEKTELKIITGSTLSSSVGLSPTTTDTQVTYTITLYNTNDYKCQFDKAKFIEKFYDNPDIIFVLSNELTTDVILGPKESVTFDITFKYKDGITPSTDNNVLNSYINFEFIVAPTTVGTYNFTADSQTFIAPYDGLYKIELWGASGESKGEFIGGKGAYTKGEIYLNKGASLNIYVGGKGSPGIAGFNGGGKVSSGYGGNSGGATDVRLDTSTLTRIMVAAGGGGAGYRGEGYGDGLGGAGGGLTAYSGTTFNNTVAYGYAYGTGGEQTTGGLMYWTDTGSGNRETGYYSSTYSGSNLYYVGGTFFQGGHAAANGGGGYYGGGAAFHGGGGGGSSFISGHDGCDAIKENSTISSIVHAGHSIHYSGHTFINTLMIDGQGYRWTNEKTTAQPGMPTQDGTSTMTGNDGNGFAKITLLDLNETLENIYISDTIYNKSNNSLENEDATITTFYKQTLISKTSLEPYVSTSNTTLKVTLHNSSDYAMTFDDITYNENLDVAYTNKNIKYTFDKQGTKIAPGESINVNVTFTYATGADLTQNKLTSMLNFKFTLEPTVIAELDYTGDYQVFTPSQSGIYKVELWGAQGGSYDKWNGGYGAYVTGEIELEAKESIYAYIGGQGTHTNVHAATIPGGYNGGGIATTKWSSSVSNNEHKSSGGGATHISTKKGILSSNTDLDSILAIAAGGGGQQYFFISSPLYTYCSGGSGGGIEGSVGTCESNMMQEGRDRYTLANQTTPGFTTYAASGFTSTGAYGKGGDGYSGGGAGLYGGGGGYVYSNGGSSYIANPLLKNKYMLCYNCTTSTEETTKTLSVETHSQTPITDTPKEGNGYIRITIISLTE